MVSLTVVCFVDVVGYIKFCEWFFTFFFVARHWSSMKRRIIAVAASVAVVADDSTRTATSTSSATTDNWKFMNKPILDKCISYLSPLQHLTKVDRVCKHWRTIAQSSLIWRSIAPPIHNWIGRFTLLKWLSAIGPLRRDNIRQMCIAASPAELIHLPEYTKDTVTSLVLACEVAFLDQLEVLLKMNVLQSVHLDIVIKNLYQYPDKWCLPLRNSVTDLGLSIQPDSQNPLGTIPVFFDNWSGLKQLHIAGLFDLQGLPTTLPNLNVCSIAPNQRGVASLWPVIIREQYNDMVSKIIQRCVPHTCVVFTLDFACERHVQELCDAKPLKLEALNFTDYVEITQQQAASLFPRLRKFSMPLLARNDMDVFVKLLKHFKKLDIIDLQRSATLTIDDVTQILRQVPTLRLINLRDVETLPKNLRRSWKCVDLKKRL